MSATAAQAHCPSGSFHGYVAGGQGSHTMKSVRTKIEWMGSSSVCNSGASYSISIVNDPGWVQAGWRYYAGYSSPKGYCERNPKPGGTGSYALTEYNVAATEQWYTYFRNDTQQFECRIGGDTLRVSHVDWLGFTNGDWIPVQAEAHAEHVQLGRIAPAWLDFRDAEKIPTGGSSWSNMGVDGVHSDDTVWNWTQPNGNGFGVNTDASH
jgi:hypothetical protein